MVPANGTVVHDDIPGPEGHSLDLKGGKVSLDPRSADGIPGPAYLLHLEPLLAVWFLADGIGGLLAGRRAGRVGHVNIRHGFGCLFRIVGVLF